jgi:hypothetical protein
MTIAACPGCGSPFLAIQMTNCPYCNEPTVRTELRSDHIPAGPAAPAQIVAVCKPGHATKNAITQIVIERSEEVIQSET